MNANLYFAFIAAAFVLIAVPGPSILVILSNSLARGKRLGFYTVLGTSLAMAIQLLVAVGGLATTMIVLSEWLSWLRWLGIAYLVYLGVRHWREPDRPETDATNIGFWQGFVVSLTNPQTMLFFAAFLPQFVDPLFPVTKQLTLLAVTFWGMALVIDITYALGADRLRPYLEGPRSRTIRGRIIGTLLLGAALALALVRRA